MMKPGLRWMSLALLLTLAPLALATKLVIAATPYVSKSGGYQIQFPTDWRWDKAGAHSSASRDGSDLDVIYVNFLKHKNAFAAIKKSSAADMSPQEARRSAVVAMKRVTELAANPAELAARITEADPGLAVYAPNSFQAAMR